MTVPSAQLYESPVQEAAVVCLQLWDRTATARHTTRKETRTFIMNEDEMDQTCDKTKGAFLNPLGKVGHSEKLELSEF